MCGQFQEQFKEAGAQRTFFAGFFAQFDMFVPTRGNVTTYCRRLQKSSWEMRDPCNCKTFLKKLRLCYQIELNMCFSYFFGSDHYRLSNLFLLLKGQCRYS